MTGLGRPPATGRNTTSGDEVILQRTGALGRITLNRPQALNALTEPMLARIGEALEAWRAHLGVHAVALLGAGERGLCAGADVTALYGEALAGGTGVERMWRREFTLSAMIARYPKPVIAVMDGLVLGGGLGLAGQASHRIVTERTRISFPETGLGLVPDSGNSWLLARAPGELGLHAALTGAPIRPAEALDLRLADVHMFHGQIPALLDAVSEAEPHQTGGSGSHPGTWPGMGGFITDRLRGLAAPLASPSTLTEGRGWIDRCYAEPTIEAILTALDRSPEPEPRDAAAALAAKSPTSLKATLALLRAVRDGAAALEDALELELHASLHCLRSPDMLEGIRAQVIDRDRRPRWSPSSLDEVPGETFDASAAPVVRPLFTTEPTP